MADPTSWIRDIRTREGALFWTRALALLLTAAVSTATIAGWVPAEQAALYTGAWIAALEGLGRLIRGDVFAEDTVDRLTDEVRRAGYEAGRLDAAYERREADADRALEAAADLEEG